MSRRASDEELVAGRDVTLPSDAELNMSTGPVHVSDHVLRSQLSAAFSPHHENFRSIYLDLCDRVKRVLRTEQDLLIMHGSIRVGLDIVLANMIGPGAKILALSNGYWGSYIADNARAHGADVIVYESNPWHPIDAEEVDRILSQHPDIDMVTAVHIETSTGIKNAIREIGGVVAKYNAIFFVDTACSAGAIAVNTDDWKIDISVTGTQKTFGSLPGLSIITMSEKAWATYERAPGTGRPGHLNLRYLFDANLQEIVRPAYTQPTSLIVAFNAAIEEIEREGIDNWFHLHADAGALLLKSLREKGFELIADEHRNISGTGDDADFSCTVFAVKVPDGLDETAFRNELRRAFGIFVIGNVGALAGLSFRIGLMSSVQMNPRNILATVAALSETRDKLCRDKGKRGL